MRYAGVELRVLHADALTHRADVLVLKFAQASYGADFAAVRAAGVDVASLPGIGQFLLVQEPAGIAAPALLLLGLEPVESFDYRTIREFSASALARAADLRPDAGELAMTLHGIGFGLDEVEAFESEVAGVVESLDTGRFPHGLRSVTFVERDEARAARMHRYLDIVLADAARIPARAPAAALARRVDSVGYDSAGREHAFVAMPFADSFTDVFHFGIAGPVRAAGLLCERADLTAFTGEVLQRVLERIASARLVVADLSDANPNVFLEVGYAWGRGVPCVLLCNRATTLPFDVQGHRCLFYSSIVELERLLTVELAGLVV